VAAVVVAYVSFFGSFTQAQGLGEEAEPAEDIKADLSVDQMLTQARNFYDELEFEKVLPYAEGVLAADGVDIQKRLDAFLLQGSALAIIGRPIDAEAPFRFLLRGRPDYDMPAETPPKILAVFRKVQAEERSIREQMKSLELDRIRACMTWEKMWPADGVGGQPLIFEFALKDPTGSTHEIRLHFRLSGETAFSSLALTRNDTGGWNGIIPGETTENEEGLVLDFYLQALASDGTVLIGLAEAQNPARLKIAPGTIEGAAPFYTQWWFWTVTAAGALAVAGSGGAMTYFLLQPPASDLPINPLN
jgi:hypothetical protein